MRKTILCLMALVLLFCFMGCASGISDMVSKLVTQNQEETPAAAQSVPTSDAEELQNTDDEPSALSAKAQDSNPAADAQDSDSAAADAQDSDSAAADAQDSDSAAAEAEISAAVSSEQVKISAVKTGKPTKAKPDGKGVLQFGIVLHLEGWNDGKNKTSFTEHAKLLREYASLFEKYGAKMSLESKEIIDGCIKWGDNVLYELQQRGHAIGIHADAGGEKNATVKSIADTLKSMKQKLNTLGISTSFASGVASKADWVKACNEAGIDTVTCMVCYGLWSLDPKLRPKWFKPYATPSQGHGPFPMKIEKRIHPWFAKSGADWIKHAKDGLLIIPSGLSLTHAAEELKGSQSAGKSRLAQEDIEAWKKALPKILAATDSKKVNTFYAVWSFGQRVDMKLLEDWLKIIKGYVDKGRIQWTVIPDMAEQFRSQQ